MADDSYLDVISFRQRGDKPYAHKIGSAKPGKDGKMNVYLDSLPLPDKDGRVSMVIAPRLQKSTGGYSRQEAPRQQQEDDPFNDPLPF